MPSPNKTVSISGLILAGGRSSRMGRDKALIRVGHQTMLEHAIEQLQQQCTQLWVSCAAGSDYPLNDNVNRVADRRDGFLGPLAGIEAALSQIDGDYLLTIPCDCRDIPNNLGQHLLAECQRFDSPIAYACNAEGDQYLCALIDRRIASQLSEYLNSGERRVGAFFRQQAARAVSRPEWQRCFSNINTPDQLRAYRSQTKKPS